MVRRQIGSLSLLLGLLLASAQTGFATITYSPVDVYLPFLGPEIAPPDRVFGKEYSHDLDIDLAGFDPEQVLAWDGSGGVDLGLDYSATRPSFSDDVEVDALGNRFDAFIEPLLSDDAHLVFSHDDEITAFSGPVPVSVTLPSVTPILLSGGAAIGGAGELSFEMGVGFGAAPSTQGIWAESTDVNGMPEPMDIDGLELWGPEPAAADPAGPGIGGDADKYSLELDSSSGVSVWNLSGAPYVTHAEVVSAVTSAGVLGPLPTGVDDTMIDLDALMINDLVEDPDLFQTDTGSGIADMILFSIVQIPNPTVPGDYYATGSELIVLDAAGMASFFHHGGHAWDKGYAESKFGVTLPGGEVGVIDVNAIEAVVQAPEPASILLSLWMLLLAPWQMRSRSH